MKFNIKFWWSSCPLISKTFIYRKRCERSPILDREWDSFSNFHHGWRFPKSPMTASMRLQAHWQSSWLAGNCVQFYEPDINKNGHLSTILSYVKLKWMAGFVIFKSIFLTLFARFSNDNALLLRMIPTIIAIAKYTVEPR